MRKSRGRNTAYSRHQGAKAGKQPRATQRASRALMQGDARDDDDVVRCFIEATLKHSKAPGAVRASKKRYPFLHPVISRGCQG